MNLKSLKSALALFSIGILTACSSEDAVTPIDTPLEKDSKFYINVSIANPESATTRTEGDGVFEDGTEEEQAIHEILFVFYNSANNYVGHTTVTLASNGTYTADGEEVNASVHPQDQWPGSVETIIDFTVPVSVSAGSLKASSVIAYINPTAKAKDGDAQRNLDQALGITRTLADVTPNGTLHKGFTMSNSVYYETGDGSTWEAPRVAVDIPEGFLFASKELAASSTDKNIKIYVERVVSKVTLTQGSVTETNNDVVYRYRNELGQIKEEVYQLKFTPLAWGLSMTEKGTFLLKNFRTSGCVKDFSTPFPVTNMSKSQVTSALASLTSPAWNCPSHSESETPNWNISGHRSFWAFSPSYFAADGSYPMYADQLNAENEKTFDDASKATYSLDYITFDDIFNFETGKPASDNNKIGSTIYTLEHTMEEAVVDKQLTRGVTSALIVGQYTLSKNGQDMPAHTFYIQNGLNNDGQAVTRLFPTEDTFITAVLELNNVLFVKKDGSYVEVPIDAAHLADFEVIHPDQEVTGGKYTPSDNVGAQLKTDAEGYYLRDSNGAFHEVTTDNIQSVNEILYGIIGGVTMYNTGYASFVVPIEHLWRTDADGSAYKKMGEEGFQAHLGQYGIVRNHHYNLKITGIDGIGSGIGDPGDPIIPVVTDDKYFVRTEIYVQRWRVVPTQNVVLTPQ